MTVSSYSQEIASSGNDGYVYGKSLTYATARSTASTASDSATYMWVGQHSDGSSYYYVERAFLKFDTSSIPSGATIIGAELDLYDEVWYNLYQTYAVCIQKWTGDAPIDTGDFNSFDNVTYGSSPTTFTDGQYNNITISNTTIIQEGSNTLICLRTDYEINGIAPATPNIYEDIQYYTFDKGAGYRPVLRVWYGYSAPAIGSGSGTNFDDTNNVYAKLKDYTVSITCSDVDGYADIRYCELFIKTSGNTTRAEFAYLEDSQTLTTPAGSANWALGSTSGDFSRSGNNVAATWKVKAHWDATEESGDTFLFFVNDTGGNWANSAGGLSSFDVVTRLVDNTAYPSTNKARANVGTQVTITAQIRYGNNPASNTPSTLYPPDSEFNAWYLHDSAHASQGSSSVSSGQGSWALTLPSSVQNNLYHVYVDYVDADATDADTATATTVSVISDRIRIDSLTASDADGRLNVGTTGVFTATASLEYDGHTLGAADTLYIAGNNFVWYAGTSNFQFGWTSSSPLSIAETGNLVGSSEATYSINGTGGNMNGHSATLIWDRIIINTLTASALRTNINNVILYQATAALEYDNPSHMLGAGDSLALSGLSFTWNSTSVKWEYSTSKATPQLLTIGGFSSGTEANYAITVGNINGKSASGIWDNLIVDTKGTTNSSARMNINTYAQFYFKLRSQYDAAYVTAGTVTLNGSLAANWNAANSRWEYNTTKTSAQSYGGLYVASASWSTCGITSLSSQTSNYTNPVIWDSVTLYLSPPTFQRININSNASGMNKWGKYDYDNASFDGTITLNQSTFNFATPQRQGYNASSIGGGTYSITMISNCNATYCIWDSVTLYLSPPTFQRININSNASGMNKWGIFNYDSASYDGTITLNQTFTFATPQRQDYNASSISGGSYPAVTLIVSCNTTYCIWDSITAYISPPTSQRIDINTNATGMQVWGIFNYDSVAYDGTLALNNTQYSYATAQRQDFNVTVASGGSYPQVTIIASSNMTYCIWDNLIVDTKGSTNATARSNVNSYVQFYFKLRSQYDGSYVTSGSVTLNGSISATWISGNARWEYNITETSVQKLSLCVASATWSAYSITSLSDQTGNYTSVIWDRIEIYAKASDSAVPTGTSVTVWFRARYEYDQANYTSGSLTINTTLSTYNSTEYYWQISAVNASVTTLAYQVSAVSDSSFGLSVFVDNAGVVSVHWYTANSPPTIIGSVPSTVYAYQQVNISVVVNDNDGAYSSEGLLNCTISFNVTDVRLNWFALDNSTTKTESLGLWSLDASYTSSVNSTAVNVTWTVRLFWNSTKGGYTVTCIVWDEALTNGTDILSFSFKDDLAVDSSSFSSIRYDPSGSAVVAGQLYYQGTSIVPYAVTGISVYCDLNGTVEGSNSSIASDGTFQITITTEASPVGGTFYYTIYSLTDDVSTSNRTASFILDRIFIQAGGIGSHYAQVNHDVLVYYTIVYESDLSPVADGTVLLNTTAMIYNGALFRWELNVTSGSVGNFTYYVSSVSGNLYGIILINDAVGSQYCFFYSYLNLNFRTVDVDGTPLTESIVYLNNGTAGVVPWEPPGTGVAVVGPSGWYSQIVSTSGWANWTGQTNSSVQIYVMWKGLTVNGTFTLPTLTDLTVDVNCFCYPYIVGAVRFWCASNATIQTATYSSNILAVAFNSPIDNYLLIASCTTKPCYITNATYDLNVNFASGYLTLTHYSNVTLKISYESGWGNLYLKATDHKIDVAAWAGPKLSITFNGTSGEIGTFSLYCGTAGTPTATSGFITTGFSSNVLSGSYAFSSSNQTVIFDWTSSGTGTGTSGTSGTELNPTTLMVDVSFNVSQSVMRGQTVNGTMNVTWTGYMIIYLWNIQCTGSYSNWAVSITGLPISLTMTGDAGHAQIPVVFKVPTGSGLGNQSVPCSVVFQLPGTSNEKTVTEIATIQVVAPAEPLNIQVWMVVGFIALLAMVPVGALFRTTKERRKYRPS